MTEMLVVTLWLLNLRLCTYAGSRRVIGGLTGFMTGVLCGYLGIFLIRLSRRLDDERADAILLEKYKPVSDRPTING